jgi:D-alanyl-D-alanine carboxypeptidase
MSSNPSKALIPAVIAGAVLLIAGLGWLMYMLISATPGTPTAATGTEAAPGQFGSSVDSGARIDIEQMRIQIEDLQKRLGTLEQEVQLLKSMGGNNATAAINPTDPNFTQERIDGEGIDSYAQVVLLAGRRTNNKADNITVSSPSFLVETFGLPRESLSDDCEPMTNPTLKALLVTEDVGPIRVSMLKPAVESMRRVFEKIKATDATLYDRISTAGALCVRRIRGSQNSVSTHAFGLAVDLNIDGVLDTLGDGKTQLGLTIIADFFQEEGWFWGASFGREDSMHFEVSREMITTWRAEGKL